MKVKELIAQLERMPNKDAEVNVHHWVILKKSDKVLLNWSKATEILRQLDGDDTVVISTEAIEEDL